MVKADLTKDYYADLGIEPGSDINEIKRAFRKLALVWHPDRNPTRVEEVTPTFQRIQEAHEVLQDPTEKAKYDANRTRSSGRFQSGGNQRGNPWSNVSSQFPQPPRPPTARTTKPPPPSAGAQRYKNFEVPRHSAYQAAQEGAEARKSTYEAWENMHKGPGTSTGWKNANNSNRQPPPPPPRQDRPSDASNPRRKPSNAQNVYEEPRQYPPSANASPRPDRRAQSSSGSGRKGFMPNTPGGDESAAPRGTYFTARKSAEAPPLPTRNTPHLRTDDIPVDPLRQFKERSAGGSEVPFDTRQSTPYATHGGEKLNPFENGFRGGRADPADQTNMNRSKSTREPAHRSDPVNLPRAGSDSNLNSPRRNYSFSHRPFPATTKSPTTPNQDETSSSDSGPELKTKHLFNGKDRPQAVPRKSSAQKQPPGAAANSSGQRVSDGKKSHGEPSMYAYSRSHKLADNPEQSFRTRAAISKSSGYGARFPTVSEQTPSNRLAAHPPMSSSFAGQNGATCQYRVPVFEQLDGEIHVPPSGAPGLYPSEQKVYNVVDDLVTKRNTYSATDFDLLTRRSSVCRPTVPLSVQTLARANSWKSFRDKAEGGSSSHEPVHFHDDQASSGLFSFNYEQKTSANRRAREFSFSIPVDNDTFQTESSLPRGSTENINTKFTPEDWDGKFQGSYFQHEQKAAHMPHPSRKQSGSRSRGRSPIKSRPVDTSSGLPQESPNPAKFSPEEWAGTFKEQTFMPPPPPAAKNPARPARKTTRSANARPIINSGTVADDSDSSQDRPVFTGRKSFSSVPSPDAMDVDTPPVARPHTPPSASRVVPQGLKPNMSPNKRPAETSGANSPIDHELKVGFEDLSVRDLLSAMNLPAPPTPPATPDAAILSKEGYDAYITMMTKYLEDWDLYNTRIILHFVARKNQNDTLGSRRLTEDGPIETYRLGLREDKVVLDHLARSKEGHSKILKECAILRETMKSRGLVGVKDERPRKKVS